MYSSDYLIKHWNQITKDKDKIMHLFMRSYVEGILDQAVQECIDEYGKELTLECETEFETLKNHGLLEV